MTPSLGLAPRHEVLAVQTLHLQRPNSVSPHALSEQLPRRLIEIARQLRRSASTIRGSCDETLLPVVAALNTEPTRRSGMLIALQCVRSPPGY